MNRAAYDAIAAQWDAARQQLVGREQAFLDEVLAPLPPGATVLDLGCGTGRPLAAYAIARGHRIIGIDQSLAQLRLARQRFPDQRWVAAALETCPLPSGCAAAICWDALFHIERRWHEPILRRLHAALAPGARLMLTVGGSAHPPFTDTMFDREFFYDSHPPETALALLRTCGYRILRGELIDVPNGGRDKGRFAIVAEVPA